MKILRMIRSAFGGVAIAAALGAGGSAQALTFVLADTGNAAANAGFAAAASYWSSVFTDSVTVNIKSGFTALDPGVLGQAGSTYFDTTYSAFRGALAADATSTDDATMVSGLGAGATYSRFMNYTSNNPNGAGSAVGYTQTGISAMSMTRANAKALGLVAGGASGDDAEITFSSLFTWDFDSSDGISAGAFDFVAVAIHEIGHALGFVSGVDVLDFNGGPVFADFQYDPFTNPLDFVRCSSASEAAGADIDWRAGRDAKSYAIDGNCTALMADAWSTGSFLGDGRQASHWKDGVGLGIMDPTLAPGELGVVSARDTQALDVIGWSTRTAVTELPEPSGILLLGIALAAAGTASRRRVSAS